MFPVRSTSPASAAAVPGLQSQLDKWNSARSKYIYSYQFAQAALALEMSRRTPGCVVLFAAVGRASSLSPGHHGPISP